MTAQQTEKKVAGQVYNCVFPTNGSLGLNEQFGKRRKVVVLVPNYSSGATKSRALVALAEDAGLALFGRVKTNLDQVHTVWEDDLERNDSELSSDARKALPSQVKAKLGLTLTLP